VKSPDPGWRIPYWKECVKALRRCQSTGRLNSAVAEDLADAIENALEGSPPFGWERKPGTGNTESFAIPGEVLALRFIKYCDAKLIIQDKPVKTICQEFEVDHRTIRYWRRKFSWFLEYLFVLPETPEEVEAWRQAELKHGMAREMMLAAAKRYRTKGRRREAETKAT
jgi:hypothetical protein